MKIRNWHKNLVAGLAVLALSQGGRSESASSPAESGMVPVVTKTPPASSQVNTNQQPVNVIQPAKIDLPPGLSDVVRMAESGTDQTVILEYVKTSKLSYNLTPDQIIYLQDLGISSDVIKALVQQGGSGTAWTPANPPAQNPTTAAPEAQPPPPPAPTYASSPPPATVDNNFYSSLAPYGTWIDLPPYGWCWQPTAVAVNPAWQPYADGGYWLWTDYGWYWNSYYSWGWAPFHYGRWCAYPRYGWLWVPDRVWGPAWVCWRDFPGYCGWAPLPPGAFFDVGFGWRFNGLAVGFGFDFGLGPACFTFVDFHHFHDRDFFHHRVHGHDRDDFFRRSHVVDHFMVASGSRIIDRGIDPQRIEAVTHTRIQQVAVREMPSRTGSAVMPDRLQRSGNSMVVYRPGPNISVPKNPSLARLAASPPLRVSASSPSAPASFGSRGETRGATLMRPSVPMAQNPSAAAERPMASRGRSEGSSSFSRPESEARPAPPAERGPERGNFERPTAPPAPRQAAPPSRPGNSGHGFHSSAVTPGQSTWSARIPSYSHPSRAPQWSQPSYSWHSTPSWSAPRAPSYAPSPSRSYSPPAFAGRPTQSFGDFRGGGGGSLRGGGGGGYHGGGGWGGGHHG